MAIPMPGTSGHVVVSHAVITIGVVVIVNMVAQQISPVPVQLDALVQGVGAASPAASLLLPLAALSSPPPLLLPLLLPLLPLPLLLLDPQATAATAAHDAAKAMITFFMWTGTSCLDCDGTLPSFAFARTSLIRLFHRRLMPTADRASLRQKELSERATRRLCRDLRSDAIGARSALEDVEALGHLGPQRAELREHLLDA
jgi:hypothetical protein